MKENGKKVRAMTITYRVEGGLYINITNKCSNACSFCIRNNGDGAYGSDSLWLEREPTVDEIKAAIDKEELESYIEAVFCGYGEPSYRLDAAREVALYIKSKKADMPVRMNTNGHSDLIHGRNTAPDFKDAFDTVSISLNTPSSERYQEICNSVYGESAFSALLDFAEQVKKYVPCVMLSVVRQTLTEEELSLCKKIAEERGVYLKVREYIS